MASKSFIKGVAFGAGIAIALIGLLIYFLPWLYVHTENRNFANLRKKSELNCETMPLHCAVQDDDIEEINRYISNGGNLELKDHWGRSALFWALSKEKYHTVTLLLNAKADPNTKDENGISIFHQAVAWGKYDVADELLSKGADINAMNGSEYPETTLHYCVMKNKPECVIYLLEHGANKYLEDSFGYTVFERVQTHDHISKEIGELLKKE